MSRLRKLAMGLLIAALCLGALELAARLFTTATTPTFVAKMPAPGESGDWLSRDAQGMVEPHFQGHFAIPPFAAEPGPLPRVIWMGGSSVRGGRGKSRPKAEMPGRTQARIGQVEVLNLGAPGIDTRHIWAMLPEVLALKPQVLVLYTGHNDTGNVLFEGIAPSVAASRAIRLRALLRRSRLFEWMERVERKGAQAVGNPDNAGRERMGTMGASQRAAVLSDYEQRLQWIVRTAKQQGVEVLLLTLVSDARSPGVQWQCPEEMAQAGFGLEPGERMPQRVDVALLEASDCPDAKWYLALELSKEHPELAAETLFTLRDEDPWATRAGRPSNEILRRVAEEEGATLVDIAEIAQRMGGGLEPGGWFTDPIHLSNLGHAQVAEHVAPVLAEILGLQQTGEPLRPRTLMQGKQPGKGPGRGPGKGPGKAPGKGPGPPKDHVKGPDQPPLRAGGGSPEPASD